jgi:hypothetical protein
MTNTLYTIGPLIKVSERGNSGLVWSAAQMTDRARISAYVVVGPDRACNRVRHVVDSYFPTQNSRISVTMPHGL